MQHKSPQTNDTSSFNIIEPDQPAFLPYERPLPTIDPQLPTKDRLLKAGMYIFAKHGYQDATISEICELASANIAAVNYHFRDKQNLYLESVKRAFDISFSKYPIDGGLPADAPAIDRLRGRLAAIIRPSFDEGEAGYIKELVAMEMSHPSGLFNQFFQGNIAALRQSFFDMLSEILGPDAEQIDIKLCAFSISSQCHSPMLRVHMRQRLAKKIFYSDEEIDVLIEHVYQFSMAGLEDRRRIIQQRKQAQ